jgi:peptidoglycan/LPS O-acetylase OafA/YrhL
MARRRLDQVDAMRPIKQAGVISTHSVLFFAPPAAGVGSAAALLLLHVSREGFFFISACMLTYAYVNLHLKDRAELRRFYRRRIVSVVIPYLCWTLIYFFYLLPSSHYPSPGAALLSLATSAESGYIQLYFLIVIMQFYLVFPLLLALLRWSRGHHGLVIAVAAAAQVAISIASHWRFLPPQLLGAFEERDALCYVLYLVGGCVVAFHLEEVHAWVTAHARLIVALTAAAALAAEGVLFLAHSGVTTVLGSGSDPFQPSVIPFNIGAITCGYLAGVALAQPWRSRRTRALVRTGSDDAYGIYLSQMLFIDAMSWLGWEKLSSVMPWPLVCLIAVVIVFACCVALTSLLARTPLAVPLTGRARQPWSTLLPRRPRPEPATLALPLAEPGSPDLPDLPGATPAALAGTTRDQNGS